MKGGQRSHRFGESQVALALPPALDYGSQQWSEPTDHSGGPSWALGIRGEEGAVGWVVQDIQYPTGNIQPKTGLLFFAAL